VADAKAAVIDADAHVAEDIGAWSALEATHPGWLGAATSGGKWVAQIGNKLYPVQEGLGSGVPIDRAIKPACEAGSRDVGARLADMDTEGIDCQVLFGGLAIGVTTFDDHGFARDFASTYNDWLIGDVCATDPARLAGVAAVAVQEVPSAIDEMERAGRAGAVAVTIPPVIGHSYLDDPAFLPFFEAAAALDLAVCIHSAPGMQVPLPAAGGFSNYALVHTMSFPADQMVALTALVMGGVLDRYPTLRIGFMESGVGWVPYFVHRIHEHHEKLGPMVPDMRSDPRAILERGQCFFSFEADEPLLDVCVDRFGPDHWVYASDYPHWDSDFPGTVDECRLRFNRAGFDPGVQAKLLGANAARLYPKLSG
jgi:predicted TIM-barrel fold metal-dependent hydrolase